MAEQQGNVGGQGGNVPSHTMAQQGQSYPLSPQTMSGMDVMSMGQMSMGGMGGQPQQTLDGSGDSLDNLAPIFPPQNFEVPDISFSNSVSPNAEFSQSYLSSAQMFGNSGPSLYTNVTTSSSHMMGGQPMNANQQQQQQAHMGMSGQGQHVGMGGQMSYFPPASSSPPGTSSSEDSDDLPLAQLAKRTSAGPPGTVTPGGGGGGGGGTAAAASPTSSALTDTASAENSPTSGTTTKKAKPSKRKKKKDPNEPQKPVSAYALFFRDTQASIKGHNPSASFGEVSKIVASMWDQLDPEHKEVYKKKTEVAKKQYLKQLAAYRASQVSQSAAEEAEKSPSPPGVGVGPPVMGGTTVGVMPVTTNYPQMAMGPTPVMTTSHMPVTMSGQMMGQQQQLQQQSPPHMMQMSPQMMQQQQQQQHHMQQMQQQMQHHQQQLQQQMQQQQQQMNLGPQASPSPPSQQQQHSPPQQQQQQQQSSPQAAAYSSPSHVGQGGMTSYQQAMVDPSNMFGFTDPGMEMDITYPQCVRSGCGNHARENPAWDSEYCSNDCVITHCRDIFTNWVSGRSGTNTFPVK